MDITLYLPKPNLLKLPVESLVVARLSDFYQGLLEKRTACGPYEVCFASESNSNICDNLHLHDNCKRCRFINCLVTLYRNESEYQEIMTIKSLFNFI